MKHVVSWLWLTLKVRFAKRRLDRTCCFQAKTGVVRIHPYIAEAVAAMSDEVLADRRFQKHFECIVQKCDERLSTFYWVSSFHEA